MIKTFSHHLFIPILLLGMISGALFFQCERDKEPFPAPLIENHDKNIANSILYNDMHDRYYWYQHVPKVNPVSYSTPQALMNDLKYDSIDKWSFVITNEEYEQHFVETESVIHGVQLSLTTNNNFVVLYVLKDSPMDSAGVKRGWVLLKVNNTSITPENYNTLLGSNSTSTFTFKNHQDSIVTISSKPNIVEIESVFHYDIIDLGHKKVGYMVLLSFVESTENQLKHAFQNFSGLGGIDELVLDLRYNTGGMVSVAQFLASAMNNNLSNKTFIHYIHNDRNTQKDTTINFENTNYTLGIDRLITITTNSTASASELIISGLEPYMDVILIGDDTHGKPVGMEGFRYGNYVFFPVTFSTINANNEGGYYNGLQADAYVEDDLNHQLGDTLESCLNEALYYINNGTFSFKKSHSGQKHTILKPEIEKALIKDH
jgi:C-terminal processing protease CtpA/Prc